jgi:cell division protein FtsA
MKARAEQSEIVVGLDVGTTKVSAVVGEVDDTGVTILGAGTVACKGLHKGVVTNVEQTQRAISEAVEAAQNMSGVEIGTVFVGVSGSHIRCVPSDGVAAITGTEVTREDVDRVLEGARAIRVDSERKVLHVLPREFIVDDHAGIRDPIGMSGVRLGTSVNLVTAASTCVQTLARCIDRCGLVVADVVLAPLASAEAVLSDDEKEIGVAVIDIGGGTTDLLLYVNGGMAHASVVPVGSIHITTDLAAGLRTPMGEAERLKRIAGCALGRMVADDEEVEVPGVGGHLPRRVPRRVVSDIVEPRVEEIFAFLRKRMEETGMLEQLAAGAVLCGGGVLLSGMVEAAEEILGMPVRMGVPVNVRGLTQVVSGPQAATGAGLVLYGAQALLSGRDLHRLPESEPAPLARGAAAAAARPDRAPPSRSIRLWEWIKEAF